MAHFISQRTKDALIYTSETGPDSLSAMLKSFRFIVEFLPGFGTTWLEEVVIIVIVTATVHTILKSVDTWKIRHRLLLKKSKAIPVTGRGGL
jgi:hypothetical protein